MNLDTQIIPSRQAEKSSSLTSTFIRPKLIVNPPGDAYEQEADAVADRVMRMSGPAQPLSSPPLHTLQRKCAHCEKDDKLQRKENSVTSPAAPASVQQTLNQSGQPLSAESRAFFEPRFEQDFSGVRIHTDGSAAESAQQINALAYTSGQNVVFGSGQYQPESEGGKRLLAHELTHVMQQVGRTSSIQLAPNDRSRQSKPVDAPRGTKPIDASGLDREDIHTIKPQVGAGPRDWVGISPEGHVITSDEGGQAVDHGPVESYLPRVSDDYEITLSKVIDVLEIIGISILLAGVVLVALLDPEPASKLGAIGLSAFLVIVIRRRLSKSDTET